MIVREIVTLEVGRGKCHGWQARFTIPHLTRDTDSQYLCSFIITSISIRKLKWFWHLHYRKQWIIRTPYDACLTVKLLMTLL